MEHAQEYSETIMEHSKKLCETTSSDKPEATRQTEIDACIEYVYTSVMTKAQADTSGSASKESARSVSPAASSNGSVGQKVYRADECVGAVVNGQCHGSIIPRGNAPTCYGTMLNGQCTGPMF